MSTSRRTTPLAVTLSLTISLPLGFLLVILSSLKVGRSLPYIGLVLPDLYHDLGIAFFVSASVAGLFELYRSNRHEMESMKDVIDFAMSDKITGEVWQEVQELMEAKKVIRRNVRLRLEFVVQAGIQFHESVLKVEHEYDLYSLRKKRFKEHVRHELDYQFRNDQINVPRWEAAIVHPSGAKAGPMSPDLAAQTWISKFPCRLATTTQVFSFAPKDSNCAICQDRITCTPRSS
jgi:hypothetical protein